ncbi:MAG: AMP-binding protein, partial [Alphaproteobacteria bacterium]
MAWTFDDLFAALDREPARPAVISVGEGGAETLPAGDLNAISAQIAGSLSAAGIAVGDPVALLGPNSAGWIGCWLAVARIGAVAVALDDLSSPEEAAVAIADADCRHVLASEAHIAALKGDPRLDGVTMTAIAEAFASATVDSPQKKGVPPALTAADAAAVMVYTSGTTGAPKSFVLTRANIAANVAALADEGILRPHDKVLLPLPLHHVYPLVVGLLTPLAAGAAVVLPQAATGPEIVRALAATGATLMIGVPRLYSALVDGLDARMRAGGRLMAAVSTMLLAVSGWLRRHFGINAGRVLFAPLHRRLGGALRIMVSGGARLEPAIVARLDALGFETLTGYGLAETASLFTGNRPGRKRIGSEGLPLAGGRIRIGPSDANGAGEIELKGPSVFSGYRNASAAGDSVFSEDGWFRTGDLGRLDADGYLYVTGRVKEMIVLGGGKNVYPEELEKRYGVDPAIAEIAVLEHGGKLVALIRPDIPALKAAARSRPRDAVRVAIEQARGTLPSYQRLAGFALVSAPLPRTRLGKYRRFQLPELYEKATSSAERPAAAPMDEADRRLVAESPGRDIWALLQARYGARGLAMDASPELDLGIDSLEWVTLALEFENRLGLHISSEDVARIVTVRDLVRLAVETAQSGTAPKTESVPSDDRFIVPPGAFARLCGILIGGLNRLVARIVFRLRVETEGPWPGPDRPFVVIANHTSDLDALFLSAALPPRLSRRVWWGGEVTRLFGSAAARALSRTVQIFPVDERNPRAAIDLARKVLERGDGLGWFPESWRSATGELQDFLPGIGMVLDGNEDAVVIPAGILGAFEVMPRTARWPRLGKVRIRFGVPVRAAELLSEGSGGTDAERVAAALRHRGAAL